MPSKSISDLIPAMQPKASALIQDVNEAVRTQGLHLVILCTRRTQAEQDALYAQGRTTPGHVVTWIRNNDPHVEGRAMDVCFARADGSLDWEGPWELIGKSAHAHDLRWGGDWGVRDLDHVQLGK